MSLLWGLKSKLYVIRGIPIMLYKMQLIAYSPSGSLISSGDVILLGKFKSTSVKLMFQKNTCS